MRVNGIYSRLASSPCPLPYSHSVLFTRQEICCDVVSHPWLAGYPNVTMWIVLPPEGSIIIVASLSPDGYSLLRRNLASSLWWISTWRTAGQMAARNKSQFSRRLISTMRLVTIVMTFVTCTVGGITCMA